jgi:hypothetical protein
MVPSPTTANPTLFPAAMDWTSPKNSQRQR